ncbi:MAG: AbrB/MazE/SpoVT family DNA-binding domain-containing protein [Pseudomonadota bacterium]
MQTAKIFTSGNSQAVRLPKEFRFVDNEVVIKKVGCVIMLFPTRYRAEDLFAMLKQIGSLEIERDQPPEQPMRDLILD